MHKKKMLEVKYYEIYALSNILRNILHDQLAFVRQLNEFAGDGAIGAMLAPFKKKTALHHFIEYVFHVLIFEELEEVSEDGISPATGRRRLPVEQLLKFYDAEFETFQTWRRSQDTESPDPYDYYMDLCMAGPLHEVIENVTDEVFFVMFGNRQLMLLLNEMLAKHLEHTREELDKECDHYLLSNGKLRRKKIPTWAQRAVFYRDRGKCVFCHRDISGLVSIGNDKHFDHIVPLAAFGLNDLTNLQLLCDSCNLAKSSGQALTSSFYERWY